MKGRAAAQWLAGVVAAGSALALASLAPGCGSARHRKPVGPPPEYELPELLDASLPGPAAPTGKDAAAP